MQANSGRFAVWRYDQLSDYFGGDGKNILHYRDPSNNDVSMPFSLDSELSTPELLITFDVSEENINVIGEKAFFECRNLQFVNCQSISSAEKSAFEGCQSLAYLQTPKLVSVGSCAFSGCLGLENVSLPETLSVCENAFAGCRNIVSVYAPKLTDVLSGAFMDCVNLAAVNFPQVSAIGSAAFYCGDSVSPLSDIECPNLMRAEPSAFYGCGSLTSVIGVSGLENIENDMFTDCEKLKTLTLLSAVRIGQNAMLGCKNLTSLYMPNVAEIGESAFCGCSGLKRIDFGYTLSAVPALISTAFDGLSGVTFYVPKNSELYDNWLNDENWSAVMTKNIIYQHTLAEAQTQ